jgi:GWxTD domain-containing protein
MSVRSVAVAGLLALMAAAGLPPAAPASGLPASTPAAAPPSRQPPDYDAPVKRWREGPVRYLLVREESLAYRKLRTTADRRAFIQRFWSKRDPDPTTPENEYRSIFYRRVAEADRSFTESTMPGWKTDRGKVYVLLGPPDETEATRGASSIQPDLILWTYRDPPTHLGLGTNAILRFARDATGEYRMTNRAFLSTFESSLGLGFQTQAMLVHSLPEERRILDDLVAAPEFPEGPIRSRAESFHAASGTLVVLTLGADTAILEDDPARRPDSSRLQAMARLVADDPPHATWDLAGPTGLKPAPEGPDATGLMKFQAGIALPPGRYTAYFALLDAATGRHYAHRQSILVPNLGRAPFAIGDITLAGRIEWLPGRSTDYAAPFVLGTLRAVPRLDDLFRAGEEIAFYFPIHGAPADPIDGLPDLDIEYRFAAARGLDPRGRAEFLPIGAPIRLTRQRGRLQAYALTLKDWQAGTYRLEVVVRDNLKGWEATASTTFRVG